MKAIHCVIKDLKGRALFKANPKFWSRRKFAAAAPSAPISGGDDDGDDARYRSSGLIE